MEQLRPVAHTKSLMRIRSTRIRRAMHTSRSKCTIDEAAVIVYEKHDE